MKKKKIYILIKTNNFHAAAAAVSVDIEKNNSYRVLHMF